VDQPLAIRELHRFLADYERQSGEAYIPEVKAEKRGEKIAVIGSGPAGLTAAYSGQTKDTRSPSSKNCPSRAA
jgi:NADPH-dependent glutamate synthase beta subunit-like oxidoreductase